MRFYRQQRFFFPQQLRGFVVQWGAVATLKWGCAGAESITIKARSAQEPKQNRHSRSVKRPDSDSRTTQVSTTPADNSAALDPQGLTPSGEVIQGMDNVADLCWI